MTIAAGTRLGPYEILAPLGAGGMGEVWKGRDTRLDRFVAIKVLPAAVAADPERLKRFEKEARSASALNHPSIVTIYDVGQTDGVSWIAMELVDGKTLRELLASGALPVKRLLQLATPAAEGLAKAHEAGIVHRDLKPENVMVTKDGLVKILDFGLAKLTSPGSGSDGASHLPTMTVTNPGVVVGTVGYMSPEQASGEKLDFRSDQFSLGSMLYEMATGKRAFLKKTAIDTLGAILNDEPPSIASLNAQVPAPLRWIVERCLSKDPEGRYGTTGDLARDLATVRDRLAETSGTTEVAPAGHKRSRLIPAAVAAAALVAGVILTVLLGRALWTVPPPRFRQLTFSSGAIQRARFAPDGRTIVYGYERRQRSEILSTQPDSTESRSLGLPPADILSVSRSGELAILLGSGGFLGPKILARVPLAGGAPREILEGVRGADWSPDGSALVVLRSVEGKNRVEFPIGHVLYESQEGVGQPRFSPKGDLIAAGDWLIDAKGSTKPRPSGAPGAYAWSPKGDEIWFSEENRGVTHVDAVSVGGSRRHIVSLPGAFILHDVSPAGALLMERFAFDPTMIGLLPGDAKERDLTWLDGSVPADISADGRLVLFTETSSGGGPARGVYLWRADDAQAVRLGEGTALALSPDGRWALTAVAGSPTSLILLPTGPGEPRPLDLSGVHPGGLGNFLFPVAGTFFPDGTKVLVTGLEEGRGRRLYLLDLAGGKPRPIGPVGAYFTDGAHGVSPDGKFVAAFGPDRTAHLFPTDDSDGDIAPQIPGAAKGEEAIRWCADGRCVFITTEGGIYRLDVRTGRRELWNSFPNVDPRPGYVLPTPDGKWYVYNYYRYRSNLFLVEGVK